jgi:DNA-binding transcriptional MerR regulator
MPPDPIDDNLEHVRAEWMRRLQAHDINLEEARAILQAMKARLEFLRTLRSRIPQAAEFAEQARYVEQEIERQAEEIGAVEGCIDCA